MQFKHSIPYNVFILNKNTEFSKLHKICNRTKSVLICEIQSILVPPPFRFLPHHFVCSGYGTASTLDSLQRVIEFSFIKIIVGSTKC